MIGVAGDRPSSLRIRRASDDPIVRDQVRIIARARGAAPVHE
jgi:hypothetical protein